MRNLNPNGCVRRKETTGGHAMRQPSTPRGASTVGRGVKFTCVHLPHTHSPTNTLSLTPAHTHNHVRSSWCPFINAFGVLSMFYRTAMSIGSGLTPLPTSTPSLTFCLSPSLPHFHSAIQVHRSLRNNFPLPWTSPTTNTNVDINMLYILQYLYIVHK